MARRPAKLDAGPAQRLSVFETLVRTKRETSSTRCWARPRVAANDLTANDTADTTRRPIVESSRSVSTQIGDRCIGQISDKPLTAAQPASAPEITLGVGLRTDAEITLGVGLMENPGDWIVGVEQALVRRLHRPCRRIRKRRCTLRSFCGSASGSVSTGWLTAIITESAKAVGPIGAADNRHHIQEPRT